MATVSFAALTHHLKLMGLRPHYFKPYRQIFVRGKKSLKAFPSILSGHQLQNFQRSEGVADQGRSGIFYLVLEFGLDFGF